jgi:hypothetical protein
MAVLSKGDLYLGTVLLGGGACTAGNFELAVQAAMMRTHPQPPITMFIFVALYP